MKTLKSIRKKIFKSFLFRVIIIPLIIIFILYSKGVRLTYKSEVEKNWEAIGAVGQWVAAFVGFMIPIAVVFLQSKLEENKKDIGESNIALLEEFQSLKKEFEDKFKKDEKQDKVKEHEQEYLQDEEKFKDNKKEDLKREAHKFVNISMITKTDRVAKHLDITNEQAFLILEELLRHDRLISAGGIISKENLDKIVWTSKG